MTPGPLEVALADALNLAPGIIAESGLFGMASFVCSAKRFEMTFCAGVLTFLITFSTVVAA